MRSWLVVAGTLAVLALFVPSGAAGADEVFSFYDLQFGMTRGEVGRHYPLDGGLVKNPGHGMSEMEVIFDREDLLMEIRASYPQPDDPFEHAGLVRALREKFVGPTNTKFPAIAVTLDEFSNRAAVKVSFLATSIREKNIDFHKNRYLKALQ